MRNKRAPKPAARPNIDNGGAFLSAEEGTVDEAAGEVWVFVEARAVVLEAGEVPVEVPSDPAGASLKTAPSLKSD
jgi:hypothetical protein